MSKYIGTTVQFNKHHKSDSEQTVGSTSSHSSSSKKSSASSSSVSSHTSSSSSSALSVTSINPQKSDPSNFSGTCSCPYFIPLISVRSKVEPYIGTFKSIQLVPCDLPNQFTTPNDILLLSKTVHAEVHPEPCDNINHNDDNGVRPYQHSSPSHPSYTSHQQPHLVSLPNGPSLKPSQSSQNKTSKKSSLTRTIVDSLPTFSPLVKNKIDPKRESKMTVYSVLLSNSTTKPNGVTLKSSLPNGCVKSLLRPEQRESNMSEVRLNMEKSEPKDGTSNCSIVNDDIKNSTSIENNGINDTDVEDIKNNTKRIKDDNDKLALTNGQVTQNMGSNSNNNTTNDSDKLDSLESGTTINKSDTNQPCGINNNNNIVKVKSLLKSVSSEKKLLLERRLSGSQPVPETPPDTGESSAPSPNWASKILNPDLKVQNTNLPRTTGLNYSHRYPSIASRAPSIISGYSVYDQPHEKLTDLRKILNPEVEKKDLETVFKAHWETFMDCRCFECTFNNAAKLITVVVLAFTFFMFTRALTNIFHR